MHLFKEGGCSDYILKGGINLRKSIEFIWLYVYTNNIWLEATYYIILIEVGDVFCLSTCGLRLLSQCHQKYFLQWLFVVIWSRTLLFTGAPKNFGVFVLLVVKRIRLRSFSNCLIIKRQFKITFKAQGHNHK